MALLIRRLVLTFATSTPAIAYIDWKVGVFSQISWLFFFNYLSLLLHAVAIGYLIADLGALVIAMRSVLGKEFRWRDAIYLYAMAPVAPGPEHIRLVMDQIQQEDEQRRESYEEAARRGQEEIRRHEAIARHEQQAKQLRLERLRDRLQARGIVAHEAQATAERLLDNEVAIRDYFAELDAEAARLRRWQGLRVEAAVLGIEADVDPHLERGDLETATQLIERAGEINRRREYLGKLRSRIEALPSHHRPGHRVRLMAAEQAVDEDRPWRKALYELERGLEGTST